MLHVALYQPVIPPNTGSVARTCVGMSAHLHLIGPLGFEITDHHVKRAGLDYWPYLKLTTYASPEDFLAWLESRLARGEKGWGVRPITKFADPVAQRYDVADYADEDVLLFGNENSGLPEAWHEKWKGGRLMIPMLGEVRSYNLSNAVSMVLAHASSQVGLFDR